MRHEQSAIAAEVTECPKPARSLVSGNLALEFAADADARSYLRRQYARYPFHVCRVLYQDRDCPGLATLYIQSCSGGVYEDDRLDLSLCAGENAEVHVSTQAATIVHGMPRGTARQHVRIQCEKGSYLEYLPDPQILFPGSSCWCSIGVRLSGNAIAVISDSFLQHDPAAREETFASYRSEIVVENAAGGLLAVDRLQVTGQSFAGCCPGVSGQFAAQATLMVASLEPLPSALMTSLRSIQLDAEEAKIGSSDLPNASGVLVRVLARDGSALRRTMHMVWCVVRTALRGAPPAERRK